MADLLMPKERTCCEGFSRSATIRRALAAGRPRPAREWDPRMPIPAGAGIDRRRFILGAAGGLLSVYGADRLGLTSRMLGNGIAEAAQGPPNPVLVSLFLDGGIDALSVLAPVADPLYRKLRPTLAVPVFAGEPFGEDPRLRWHPAAASFAKLHDAGKVTVFPGIGYSSPDMSHFTSRHYWEVGATETGLVTGWLGRYLDLTGSPTNPLQGLSMDGRMNPTIATARNPVAAIDRPEDFSLWLEGVWGDVFSWTLDSAAALGESQRSSRDTAIAQVASAASEVGAVRRALAPLRNANGDAAYSSPVIYPKSADSELPQRLAGLAAMLALGLPLRCVALTTDTQFDTHSAQRKTFDAGLSLAADSIAAFQADLEARGLADRVLMLLAGGSADASRAPARMLVYAQEWSLYPSRASVPAGRVTVQLWNRGQDAHDVRIRRLDRHGRMIGRAQTVGVTQSGKLREASWRLKPGHYELYCSMPGHLKLGMHSRLIVR